MKLSTHFVLPGDGDKVRLSIKEITKSKKTKTKKTSTMSNPAQWVEVGPLNGWVQVPSKKGSSPKSPPMVPSIPGLVFSKSPNKSKFPPILSLPLGYTTQSVEVAPPMSPEFGEVAPLMSPKSVEVPRPVNVVPPPMFHPTEFPPLDKVSHHVKSPQSKAKLRFSKNRKVVQTGPKSEGGVPPVVEPFCQLVIRGVPMPGTKAPPSSPQSSVPLPSLTLSPNPPVVFVGVPLPDRLPPSFFLNKSLLFDGPPESIDYRKRMKCPKPPVVCIGWGWKGLQGGGPKPALSRGQLMIQKAREKDAKEKKEKEMETNKANASVMRDLLGTASKYPPSVSSSTAADVVSVPQVQQVWEEDFIPENEQADPEHAQTVPQQEAQSCKTTSPDSSEEQEIKTVEDNNDLEMEEFEQRLRALRGGEGGSSGRKLLPDSLGAKAHQLASALLEEQDSSTQKDQEELGKAEVSSSSDEQQPPAKISKYDVQQASLGEAADQVPLTLTEAGQDLDRIDQLVISSPSNSNNRVAVITPLKTPKKTADHNLPHTPDHRLPYTPDHRLPHTPVQQPLVHPYQGSPEPQPVIVDCVSGNIPGVIFLGRAGCRNWDKRTLKNYFFILPAYEQKKVVTLRADHDCKIEYIFQQVLTFYRRDYNILFSNPILSCEGMPVSLEQFLFSKLEKTVFLIHEGTIPDELRSHQGKVWQCKSCDGAWTSSWKKSAKCDHDFWFFPGQLEKSTGHTLDRTNQIKPWGCPTGHNGPAHLLQQGVKATAHNPGPSTAQQPVDTVRPRTAVLIRTPEAGTSRAPQPKSSNPPRAQRSPSPNRKELATRRLDAILADIPTLPTSPAPSSSSSPVPSKLSRAAKTRATKKLALTDEPLFSGDSCEEDISGDNSDSDAEFKGDEPESSSDGAQPEKEPDIAVKNAVPQTDDEEEDDEDDRLARRAVKESLLKEIKENLKKEPAMRSHFYYMDEQDEVLLQEQIVAPLLKKSGLWQRYGHKAAADIVSMVRSGKTPKKKDKVQFCLFSSTANSYLRGLKQLLGFYQHEVILAGMDNQLIEGQLKVRQFFSIKQPFFLELPHDIERLLDKMITGNAKNCAFSGFMQLIDSLYRYCNNPQGQKLFLTRTDEQIGLTEDEMKRVAKRERQEFKTELKQLKDDMTLEKPYGRHTGQKKTDTEDNRTFADKFENYRLPDPQVVIPKFLACEDTRSMYRELERLSVEKTVLAPTKMSSLSRRYCEVLISKMGIRQQCLGDGFSRAHYWEAVGSPPASFPYVPAKGLDSSQKSVRDNCYLTEEGDGFYVRENPFDFDPNDPNDPRASESWQLQQGIAVKIQYHKTGAKYPVWLWFSQTEQFYLKMYEEVASNFLLARGLNVDKTNPKLILNKTPFFISGSGGPVVYPHSQPLNFSGFAMVAGIPYASSHIFRRMFSGLLMAQPNIALRECEEWVMAHGPSTAKDHYRQELTNKLKACKANNWYQAMLSAEKEIETGASTRNVYTSKDQAERQRVAQMESHDEMLDSKLTAEDRRDEAMIPTKERILNNTTRVALVRLCMTFHNENITREGKLMDLIMTSRPIRNKVTFRVVLRMLCKVPQENPDMVTLKENLMLWADLSSGDDYTPRELMWEYARKLMEQLYNLKHVPHIDSTNLKALLGSLIKDHEYTYTFGNSELASQLTHWRVQELAREQSASVPDNFITMEGYLLAREQKRLQAQLVKDAKQTEELENEHDRDESDESDHSDSAQPKSVTFKTLTDCPTQMKIGPVTLVAEPGTSCEFSPLKQYQAKGKGGRGALWTNDMKVQLLRLYLEKAKDPLARPAEGKGFSGRAVYRAQVP